MIQEIIIKIIKYLKINNYIYAVAVFLLFYIFSQMVVWITEKILLRLAKKTKTNLDDKLIKRINRPISILLLFIGLRIGISTLDLSETITKYSNNIFNSLIFLMIVYVIVAIIDSIINLWGEMYAKKTKSTIDDNIVRLGTKFIKILGIIIGFLIVLDIWGVEIGPFLASLGIAGLAIAFALQKTLGNIFGGISLILDKTIKVGDVIFLDKTKGTVIDVGIRSTKIKTFDNELVIVPNGELETMQIQNIVQPDPSARVVIPFGVAYGSNIEKVKKIVLKEINKIKGVLKDPEPSVMFRAMGDSALLFKAYFRMEKYNERFRATDEANTLIYNALNQNKIEIPFPQMDVHVKEFRKRAK